MKKRRINRKKLSLLIRNLSIPLYRRMRTIVVALLVPTVFATLLILIAYFMGLSFKQHEAGNFVTPGAPVTNPFSIEQVIPTPAPPQAEPLGWLPAPAGEVEPTASGFQVFASAPEPALDWVVFGKQSQSFNLSPLPGRSGLALAQTHLVG